MEAVNVIHRSGISHRDLKPENFIFEDPIRDNLKLIDFGLSSIFIPPLANEKNSKSQKSMKLLHNMKTFVGTSWYIAPEVYNQRYTEKCDIWSAGKVDLLILIGVILYIMLCGYPPFYGETAKEIQAAVLEAKLKFDEEGKALEHKSHRGVE
jgi:calcium-dependent protein kinase